VAKIYKLYIIYCHSSRIAIVRSPIRDLPRRVHRKVLVSQQHDLASRLYIQDRGVADPRTSLRSRSSAIVPKTRMGFIDDELRIDRAGGFKRFRKSYFKEWFAPGCSRGARRCGPRDSTTLARQRWRPRAPRRGRPLTHLPRCAAVAFSVSFSVLSSHAHSILSLDPPLRIRFRPSLTRKNQILLFETTSSPILWSPLFLTPVHPRTRAHQLRPTTNARRTRLRSALPPSTTRNAASLAHPCRSPSLHAPTAIYSLREFLLAIAWLPAATCLPARQVWNEGTISFQVLGHNVLHEIGYAESLQGFMTYFYTSRYLFSLSFQVIKITYIFIIILW